MLSGSNVALFYAILALLGGMMAFLFWLGFNKKLVIGFLVFGLSVITTESYAYYWDGINCTKNPIACTEYGETNNPDKDADGYVMPIEGDVNDPDGYGYEHDDFGSGYHLSDGTCYDVSGTRLTFAAPSLQYFTSRISLNINRCKYNTSYVMALQSLKFAYENSCNWDFNSSSCPAPDYDKYAGGSILNMYVNAFGVAPFGDGAGGLRVDVLSQLTLYYNLVLRYQSLGHTHVATYYSTGQTCSSGCYSLVDAMVSVGGIAVVVDGTTGQSSSADWQQPSSSDGIYSPNGLCPPEGCPALCPPEGCQGSGSTGGSGGTGGTGTGGTGTGTGGTGTGGVGVPGGGETGWSGGVSAGEQSAVGGEGKIQKCPQQDGSEVDCPRGRTGMKPVLPDVSPSDFYVPKFTNLNDVFNNRTAQMSQSPLMNFIDSVKLSNLTSSVSCPALHMASVNLMGVNYENLEIALPCQFWRNCSRP
jgi:hypothetical protein